MQMIVDARTDLCTLSVPAYKADHGHTWVAPSLQGRHVGRIYRIVSLEAELGPPRFLPCTSTSTVYPINPK